MSACEKSSYRTGKYARREARKLKRETGLPFRAYACPDCGQWHLSTRIDQTKTALRPRGSAQRSRHKARTKDELEAIAKQLRQGPSGPEGGSS